MTTKHTPGPWTTHPHSFGAEVRSIAQVAWCGAASTFGASGGQNIDAAEACANANLIAAAPDLLEALEAALGCLNFFGTDQIEPFRVRCRAAIARAKGQSSSTDTARATE